MGWLTQIGRVGLCLGLAAQAPAQSAVNASQAVVRSRPLQRLFVGGNSLTRIQQVLQTQVGQPYCYADFLAMAAVQFEGVPYGSGGRGAKEGQTLIQVEQMDCVTFVENLLAMAFTAQELSAEGQLPTDWVDRFTHHLDRVRYYQGQNCTWDDRIYYFSDLLYQLADQGLARDLGQQAGVPFVKPIDYISRNRHRYRGIRSWPRIQGLEQRLSQRPRYWFPISEVDRYRAIAQDGDIIAFVTTLEGLEVSHCGFVQHKGTELAFTHASSAKELVTVRESLCDYLARRTTIAGILVFRPLW